MAMLVDRSEIDVITWVPTTATRRRERGFDQAQLLARAVARRLRLPNRSMLVRGAGPPQTGRTGIERHVGPVLAARPLRRMHQARRVLLVDDVVTTGTTVTTAARALKAVGVDHVIVVTAARTPLKRARASPDIQLR
jgi:predicted amidophosphoribosyltransferase